MYLSNGSAMTFYFKPPRGNILLHNLEECIQERVRYLSHIETVNDITRCVDDFKFEYLTDGSALDRTGHFMLRMISLKNSHLKDFMLKGETLLFQKRLKCSNVCQVKTELRTALRHVREILDCSSPLLKFKVFLRDFLKVCSKMLLGDLVNHSFHPSHSENCDQFNINVPFNLCLSFISSRTVDLSNGFAVVPCGKWSQLLSCLFLEHMKHGLEQLYSSISFKFAWLDDRVQSIARTIRPFYETSDFPLKALNLVLTSQNVDDQCVNFPPCMSSLHETLRLRHRLTHDSRFYYSLFLKDIGMPLFESVQFWSREYLQPHSNCASCSHSWQKDERRYLYSIRHMYGLEGSRRGYRSHSCRQLQSLNLGPSAEGGCPFVHFDKKSLFSLLHGRIRIDEKIAEAIIKASEGRGSQGCHIFFEVLEKLHTGGKIDLPIKLSGYKFIFKTPAEFYLALITRSN